MHKLAIVLMFVAIFGLIPSFAASQIYAQQKSIIKHEQDFNDDTIDVFNELFEECPAGTVLYKLNGEMVIVCLIDSTFGTIINNIDGSQTIDINVHVDDHDKKRHHHNGGNNNHNDTSGGPDGDCLYNASLPKCDPDSDGNCPDGFNMNEDGNCFPDHSDEGCPEGTHGVDDDETGQCYKDNEVDCPSGMELVDGNCRYIPEENNEEPPVVITPTEETVEEDNTLEMASDDEATPPQPTTEEPVDNTDVSTDESSDSSGEEEQQEESVEEEDNNN